MSGSLTSHGVVPVEQETRVRLSRGYAFVDTHVWVLGVWAAMLLWTVALYLVVREHFVHFRLARYDLGNMVQAVWSTAHGRPLEITNGSTGEQMTRLGSHVDPILALLAPVWWAVPSPLSLIAVQIAAVALGALPLFWLARRRLESQVAAALISMAYLAYPWTAWTAADAFHPVTLAIPLFLFCVWFLDTDRLVPFAACAVLVAMTGELMALGIAGLGLWYAFAKGHKQAGLAIAASGVTWSAVALLVIVPAFSGGESVFYGAYDDVGGSPWGIFETAFTDPLTILREVSERRDLLYVALLAAPLIGAFLLAPGLAAVSLPQLVANLLAGFIGTTDPHAHYVAGILPFWFAAIAVGVGRLSSEARIRCAVLVLTLTVSSAIVGPWPGALAGKPSWSGGEAAAGSYEARRAAVALVPRDAAVSVTNRFGSHLSDRRHVYSVPVLGRADWLVVDKSDPWIPGRFGGDFDVPEFTEFLDRIERSLRWRKVFERGTITIYRRVAT